jgi:hypothetical protein
VLHISVGEYVNGFWVCKVRFLWKVRHFSMETHRVASAESLCCFIDKKFLVVLEQEHRRVAISHLV